MNSVLTRNRRTESAFTLVEVTLAIGVVALAFVAIFGLIPTGLNAFGGAMDTTIAAQIAQRLINEAEQSDFDSLTRETSPDSSNQVFLKRNPLDLFGGTVRWFDDQGNELSSAERAIYHVHTRVMPETPFPQNGTAQDNEHLATVVVQVANNPGNRELELETERPYKAHPGPVSLWTGAYASAPSNRKAVRMVTYTALVSRNK